MRGTKGRNGETGRVKDKARTKGLWRCGPTEGETERLQDLTSDKRYKKSEVEKSVK